MKCVSSLIYETQFFHTGGNIFPALAPDKSDINFAYL